MIKGGADSICWMDVEREENCGRIVVGFYEHTADDDEDSAS